MKYLYHFAARAAAIVAAFVFFAPSVRAQQVAVLEESGGRAAVASAPSGHFFVAGDLRDGREGVAKYSPDLEELWYVDAEGVVDVVVDRFGYVFAGGGHALVKLDAHGETVWTAETEAVVRNLAVDVRGDVYVAGYDTEVDCDRVSRDVIVEKYDAEGRPRWRATVDDVIEGCYYYSSRTLEPAIAVDAAGNLAVTGRFRGRIDFDPGDETFWLTSGGWGDAFVLRLSTAGAFVGAFRLGTIAGDTVGHDVAFDMQGNLYVAGYFTDDADFKPGPGTHTLSSPACDDGFIAKYAPDGSLLWANDIGGEEGCAEAKVFQIAVDPEGSVYATGYFFDWYGPRSQVDFDPGPATETAAFVAEEDAFLAKYDANGAFEWVAGFGASRADTGTDIAAHGSDGVLLLARVFGDVDFDPGPGERVVATNWASRQVLARYDAEGVLATRTPEPVPVASNEMQVDVYPNPFAGRMSLDLALSSPQVVRIEVYDLLGRRVARLHDGHLDSATAHAFELDASALSDGLYLVRVESEHGTRTYGVVLRR